MLGGIYYFPDCKAMFKADPLSAIGQVIREREGGVVTDPSAVPAASVAGVFDETARIIDNTAAAEVSAIATAEVSANAAADTAK